MKLDTLRVAMSAEAARPNMARIEREGTHRVSKGPNGDLSYILVEPRDTFGLRSVKADLISGEINIEISSKLLGPDFGRGISDATAGEIAETLAEHGIVAPSEDALREARVYRADAFVDVPLAVARAKAAVASLHSKTFPLDRRYATSLAVSGPAALGLRLSVYDKGAELRGLRSRSFRAWIGPEVVGRYEGVTRVELQASKFAGLRHLGAIGVPRLDDLLQAQKLPISEHLQRMKEKVPPSALGGDPYVLLGAGLSLAKIERRVGCEALMEHFAYEWPSIEGFIRDATGRNASRHLDDYRRLLRAYELAGDTGVSEARSSWLDELLARVEDEERRALPL